MSGNGEERTEIVRPEFNPAIMTDFRGLKTTWDMVLLLPGWIDESKPKDLVVGDPSLSTGWRFEDTIRIHRVTNWKP
jgi:hypothetical protein